MSTRTPAAGRAPAQALLIAAATALTATLYRGFFADWSFLPRLTALDVVGCALAFALTAVLPPRPAVWDGHATHPPVSVRPAGVPVLTALATAFACAAGFAVTALYTVLPSTLRFALPGAATVHSGWRALSGGWAAMLSIAAPAPDTPQLLMTPALLTWLTGFLAVTVALRTRSVLGPAALVVCAEAAGLTFASNAPTTHLAEASALLMLLLALSITRAAEHTGAHHAFASTGRRPGARRALGYSAALTAIGLALALATTPLAVAGRYNPRDLLTDPLQPAHAPDPLSEVRAQLRLATPLTLFTLTLTGSAPGATSAPAADGTRLIQTTALEDFDGTTWSSPDTFRVAGPVLAPGPATPGAATVTEHVTLTSALPGPYLPVAGRATRIDAHLGPDTLIGFDPTSGTLVADPASGGLGSYTVTAEQPPAATQDDAGLDDAAPGRGPAFAADLDLPPVPDAFRALAVQITAGDVTAYAKLSAIDAYLRALPVNLDAPAGDSFGTLQRLLTADTAQGRAGYADQHAAAFAILARLEQIPTRVVVGYRLPATTDTTETANPTYTVTTADGYAWAQAYLQGYGWIDFDPTDTTDTIPLPSGTAPAAAHPSGRNSAAAKPTSTVSSGGVGVYSPLPIPTLVSGPVQAQPAGGTAARTALLVLAAVLAACGLVLAAATALRRALRRRRRRHAGPPAVRVVGAWEEAVERLADTGVVLHPAETAFDLADRAASAATDPGTAGAPHVGRSRRGRARLTREQRALALAAPHLRELAERVTAAAFSGTAPRAEHVTEAWDLERQLSSALYRGRRAPYRAAHWTLPIPRHRTPGRRR